MGDCHCSNITIMQLFHELKQQFPALPDYVVSQCIAQNSHDKEICARSLRATQESRSSSAAFPPLPPPATLATVTDMPTNHTNQSRYHHHHLHYHHHHHNNPRPHRPATLDIGVTRASPRVLIDAPASAPASCPSRGFFDDLSTSGTGFELNVNVACSPAGVRDFRTAPVGGKCKRSALRVEPQPHYIGHGPDDLDATNGLITDNSRSYTSVRLTLRPPSLAPQPPINIRSEGSSLTYSTSSVDPRGFQSRLRISIGPGNLGSVAAARIRPPAGPTRSATLLSPMPHKPPGLPDGPPSQLPRPTTTMSAPTTPSIPTATGLTPSKSLPTSPASSLPLSLVPNVDNAMPTLTTPTNVDLTKSPLNLVADHQQQLVAEQEARKDCLSKALKTEREKLDTVKRELESLVRQFNSTTPLQELKRKLESEIYQLQIECDRMAREVDQKSDPTVPLGETNEEFYQSIYTGQPLVPFTPSPAPPPPLPSRPPAWAPIGIHDEHNDSPWACRMCTFNNHPSMDKCEQCYMPRFSDHGAGTVRPKYMGPIHFRPRFNAASRPNYEEQLAAMADTRSQNQ